MAFPKTPPKLFLLLSIVSCLLKPRQASLLRPHFRPRAAPIFSDGKFTTANSPDKNFLGNVKFDSTCKNFLTMGERGRIQIGSRPANQIFWWYFPHADQANKPLVVYFGGRLGGSSLLGLFKGLGPCLFKDGQMMENPYSWHKIANVLFVENSLGTGMASGDIRNIPTDTLDIRDTFLQFFGKWFPLHQKISPDHKNPNVILSVSDEGALYLPFIADAAYSFDGNNEFGRKLDGIFIISSYVDPLTNMQSLLK